MPHVHEGQTEILVKVGSAEGVTAIPSPSPLTRLNYYDGKFLRAADFKLEQEYLRRLNALSNQAGGAGVVHGFDCVLLGGDQIGIGPGLAIDPAGRVLVLPQEKGLSLTELIGASRRREQAGQGTGFFHECDFQVVEEPAEGLDGAVLYVITIGHAEAWCGEEDVYGKLCEDACVTRTDRPYILEGVVVRAVPLQLRTPLVLSAAFPLTRFHLRSRVAAAYFEDERRRIASLISRDGLASEAWCLGALPLGGTDVPIAVVARAGTSTVFLDAWTVRRERMDAPPRQYWAWRMAMRPWSVFLAQVLQFQCQLRDAFGDRPDQGGDIDPCADGKALLHEAAKTLGEMMTFYGKVSARIAKLDLESSSASGLTQLKDLQSRLVKAGQAVFQGTDRILLRRGIVEMSSAGYLPVLPSSSLTVNQQVRRLLGPGVDLRFCVVRPDYVPHALEEAQHMERISLLQGLDDPQNKPQVDILVPDGQILQRNLQAEGLSFRAKVELQVSEQAGATMVLPRGAARSEILPSGGGAVYFTGAAPVSLTGTNAAAGFAAALGSLASQAAKFSAELQGSEEPEKALFDPDFSNLPVRIATLWAAFRCETNPFTLSAGASVPASARLVLSSLHRERYVTDLRVQGEVRIDHVEGDDEERLLAGRLSGFSAERKSTSTSDPEWDNHSGPLSMDFRLALRRLASGERVIEVLFPKVKDLRIRVSWQGEPVTAEGQATSKEKVNAAFKAQEDPAVRVAGDPDHTLALQSLEVLGASLAEARFAEDSARLLFPPPRPAAEELEVRAVRDWVLFHRRRTRTCAAETVQPVQSPVRKYQVLHLRGTMNTLPLAWNALKTGAPELSRFEFEPVTAVDFAGGSSVLTSDTGDVLEDWKAVDHGSPVLFAGIATQGAAAVDGNALAEARLTRLTGVLAAATPLDPNAVLEVLPKFPDSLAAPGTDGVIVLLAVGDIPPEPPR
ncbi:MAG TPA: hypothetical protein VH394_04145 [Thermoanaerobaculia bacterium]|jgi:hypothetical protein|nr:hypothetical protein [Thermoanaerobaculia bacterium]